MATDNIVRYHLFLQSWILYGFTDFNSALVKTVNI